MAAEIDILAFSPHPDDVEMCCGGLLISMAQRGYRVAVVDLSLGELASNGSVQERQREAQAASEILGLCHRENLKLPDGHLSAAAETGRTNQVAAVVAALRRLRPEMVLWPWRQARHPDHRAAHELVSKAMFFANVTKYQAPGQEPRFKVKHALCYQMRHRFRPSFVVDISSVIEQKLAAVRCYQSQFNAKAGQVATLLNSDKGLEHIELRDRYYGAMLGVSHAEPYLSAATLGITDPLAHFRSNPTTQAEFFDELGA